MRFSELLKELQNCQMSKFEVRKKMGNDPLFNISYVDCILDHVFHHFSDILWPLIVLQPIELQGCIVPHLKVLKKE